MLLRPTEREYLNFARALDLMLSENIDPDSFPGGRPRMRSERNDGRMTEKRIGSIQLLEDWLRQSFRFEEGYSVNDVCKALRTVRSDRSRASHRNIEDLYGPEFEQKQRDLMMDAYASVRTLRMILSNYAGANSVRIPKWILHGEIRMA